MSTKPCVQCNNLGGCSILLDDKGLFDQGKVFTESSVEDCMWWEPLPVNNSMFREQMYNTFGMGLVKTLHLVKGPSIKEEEDGMNDTDLTEILRPGMTKKEREEQLRYLTDVNGSVILDQNGNPRIRGALTLRDYCIGNSYIDAGSATHIFLDSPALIKIIIKKEYEAGLLTKDPKESPEPVSEPNKESAMPVAPAIHMRRPGVTNAQPAAQPAARPAGGAVPSKALAPAQAPAQVAAPPAATRPATSKAPAQVRVGRSVPAGRSRTVAATQPPPQQEEAAPECAEPPIETKEMVGNPNDELLNTVIRLTNMVETLQQGIDEIKAGVKEGFDATQASIEVVRKEAVENTTAACDLQLEWLYPPDANQDNRNFFDRESLLNNGLTIRTKFLNPAG